MGSGGGGGGGGGEGGINDSLCSKVKLHVQCIRAGVVQSTNTVDIINVT